MVIGELLVRFDDATQVGIHQFHYDVYLIQLLIVFRQLNIFGPQNIAIIQESHDPQLAQRPLGEYRMIKRLLNFLDGYLFPSGCVCGGYDYAVSTCA